MSKVLLNDVVEIHGRVGWKGYTVDDLTDFGPLVLGANEITADNQLNLSDVKHLTREKYEESPEIFIKKDDILVVKVGSTIGKVGIISTDLGEASINPNCVIVRATAINPYYLYYYMCSPAGHAFLVNNSAASGQPALNQATLKKMEIPLVKEKVQKSIADFLNRINKRISNNSDISSTLESLAKTIYDYWFVQFDFPDENGKRYKSSGGKMVWNEELKREIPEGWEVGKFRDVLEIGNGKDHKALSDGNVPVYGSGGLMRLADSQLYDGESVLIPRKGTLNNIMYVNEAFWTVDTMYYTKMKAQNIAKYMYYVAQSYDFERLNTGTGVPSMTSDIIYKLKVLLPQSTVLKRFDDYLSPLFYAMKHIREENQQLASLRDFLLPMLMNGQVKVVSA